MNYLKSLEITQNYLNYLNDNIFITVLENIVIFSQKFWTFVLQYVGLNNSKHQAYNNEHTN